MAKGTLIEPAFIGRLTTALQEGIGGAQVRHEQVRRERYRFVVVSDQFDDLGHPERQQIVWDIAGKVLDQNELWNVAMILTLGLNDVPSDE